MDTWSLLLLMLVDSSPTKPLPNDIAFAGQTFSQGLEQSSGQSSGSNSGKALTNQA